MIFLDDHTKKITTDVINIALFLREAEILISHSCEVQLNVGMGIAFRFIAHYISSSFFYMCEWYAHNLFQH